MVGFEDSVNVAEETKEPSRIFPPALFTGLMIAGVVYVLVAITASMVVPTQRLVGSSGPLLEVVKLGPFDISTKIFAVVALVAVSNSALINMIMASRLAYGMGNQGIIPAVFSRVHRSRQTPWVSIIFTTLIAVALVATTDVEALGATTAALLLAVFAVVNVTVLVLRRKPVEHDHFVAPSAIPIVAAVACALLLTRQEGEVLLRALILVGVGVGLYIINWLVAGRTETLEAEELKG
jgi:amino acid transporter